MGERPDLHAAGYPPGGVPVQPTGPPPPPMGGYGGPQRPSFEGRPSAIKRSGGGWAVILGGGCAIVLISGAIVAVVVLLISRAGGSGDAPGTPPGAPAPAGRIAAREVRELRDASGRLAFAAELQNGNAPVGAISARLRLLSGRTEVSAATCVPPVRLLGAGEKAPCTFTFLQSPPAYDRFEVAVDARPPPPVLELASVAVVRSALAPRTVGAGLDGTIANQGGFPARSVAVLVTFFGADAKLVGAGTFQLGRELRSGATAGFTVSADVAAPARTFVVKVVGYRD